jgi:hypothetical protein
MFNNHEFQDQDLQLSAANQVVELDDNELGNIAGGAVASFFSDVYISKFRWDRPLIQAFAERVGAALSTPKA